MIVIFFKQLSSSEHPFCKESITKSPHIHNNSNIPLAAAGPAGGPLCPDGKVRLQSPLFRSSAEQYLIKTFKHCDVKLFSFTYSSDFPVSKSRHGHKLARREVQQVRCATKFGWQVCQPQSSSYREQTARMLQLPAASCTSAQHFVRAHSHSQRERRENFISYKLKKLLCHC